MSSQRKNDSNSFNANLSTGPRTPEGKAVSSLNGTTHGMSTSRISPKNPEALAALRRRIDAYTKHYNPHGNEDPILADLIEDLAHSRVRKDLIEDRLAGLPDDTSHEYQLMHRYLREAANSYHRALKTIESIRNGNALRDNRAKRTQIVATELEIKLLETEAGYNNPGVRGPLGSLRQEIRKLNQDLQKDPDKIQ